MPPSLPSRVFGSFSVTGLLLGALFCAASLTPSLIPRTYIVQGVLAGVSLAVGYGFGNFVAATWRYLGVPDFVGRVKTVLASVAAAFSLIVLIAFFWRSSDWQNSIRERMAMPPVGTIHPLEVAGVAIAVFLALLLLARLLMVVAGFFGQRSGRFLPPRLARIAGVLAAGALLAFLLDGLLLRGLLHMADYSFRTVDALIDPDIPKPADPAKTGSPVSLVDWKLMGRAGREYVSTGPTRADIEAFRGEKSLEPLRVYVGLNNANSAEARADLALRELIRVGGFERGVLVVAVPTGTGWIDPAAADTLEYLLAGDVATVAVQYSYLSSPLSLLVEPGVGTETGRALFRAIYRHWTALPKRTRPKLYLHGLSLGAHGSALSVQLHEVFADVPQGALWSGPPFVSPIWRSVTDGRVAGTPEWLPRFGDSSLIRFTNQQNALDVAGAAWGAMRVVYLQYASDPITFFSPDLFYRMPAWMNEPRGPDVSPKLQWFPVITFLQLLVDMGTGLSVPVGYGHSFAPEHYIDAWEAVLTPQGWTAEDIDRLKAKFAER